MEGTSYISTQASKRIGPALRVYITTYDMHYIMRVPSVPEAFKQIFVVNNNTKKAGTIQIMMAIVQGRSWVN